MLAWRSCKRMFKSQRKCNINCNVGMNMLTLCEFLVFYLPFVVAFYGWTVVSCQLGFSWGSPGAVKGSCNMCNLQSQKLRAVHPCFASYVHDAVHLSEKQLHMLLQPTCQDILNISQRGRRKTTRTHPTYFCKYTGQGISSPSGHTSETLDLGFWFYSGLKMHHSALFPALFRQRRNAVLSLMLLHRQNLSMKSKKIIPTWGPFKPEFAIFEYCCA